MESLPFFGAGSRKLLARESFALTGAVGRGFNPFLRDATRRLRCARAGRTPSSVIKGGGRWSRTSCSRSRAATPKRSWQPAPPLRAALRHPPELCEPDEFDELEREERAYFDAENALVERVIIELTRAAAKRIDATEAKARPSAQASRGEGVVASQARGRGARRRVSGHRASSMRSTIMRSAAARDWPRSTKARISATRMSRTAAAPAVAVEEIAGEGSLMRLRGRGAVERHGNEAARRQYVGDLHHRSAPRLAV